MKLRNKKTGQEGNFIINKDHFECVDLDYVPEYRNLAELNEEWEDYDETKEHWYINEFGTPEMAGYFDRENIYDKMRKLVGNDFETEEEAEKAVEKLKAWKRLKDKGAEFYGWRRNQTGTYELYMRWEDRIPRSYEVKKDLDLLFGGEE